jgi:DNA (cytosine-5)-methyltransferase 1
VKVGSLFSGAGGFDIGFDRAGFSLAWQVEIDRTARDVLARHWPGVQRFEDIREVGKKELQPVDVIVGGFPCQDVSTAGKRKGFKGARSSLWFEMVRVIDELRPACVVWENVPGLLSSEEGRDFLAVLVELDRLGFAGGWRTVDAQFFGVPQQRRRVFGVFARGRSGAERAAEILALTEGVRRRTPKGKKAGAATPAPLTRGSGGGGINPPGRRQEDDINLVVYGVGNGTGERAGNGALTAKNQRQDFDTENFVLSQVIPIDMRQASRGEKMTNNRPEGLSGGAPGTGIGNPGDPCPTVRGSHTPAACIPCLAPDGTPKGRDDGLAYTLTGRQQRGHGNGMAVCVTSEGADAGEDGTGRGTPIVAFNPKAGGKQTTLGYSEDVAGTLSTGHADKGIVAGPIVRRLTPRECERLMGWPDDWTRWRANGKEIADEPRYRLCGNGVVGTVAEWIARRLMEAHP